MQEEAAQIMEERFGKDSLIALATAVDGKPHVRTIDGVYHGGSFYAITHSLSGKMRQIRENPNVAVCGEWFTGHGIAENLGWVRSPENEPIADMLRKAFAAWYDNGHTNEQDPNTCILRIRLTDGVLFGNEKRYEINF